METFGEYIKSLRILKEITLRKFCQLFDYDPSNWSKIERNINPPPKEKEQLESIASILKLEEDSEDYNKLFDLAAISHIPKGLLKDEEVLEKLPVFFKTYRGENPTEKELDELYNCLTTKDKQEIKKIVNETLKNYFDLTNPNAVSFTAVLKGEDIATASQRMTNKPMSLIIKDKNIIDFSFCDGDIYVTTNKKINDMFLRYAIATIEPITFIIEEYIGTAYLVEYKENKKDNTFKLKLSIKQGYNYLTNEYIYSRGLQHPVDT